MDPLNSVTETVDIHKFRRSHSCMRFPKSTGRLHDECCHEEGWVDGTRKSATNDSCYWSYKAKVTTSRRTAKSTDCEVLPAVIKTHVDVIINNRIVAILIMKQQQQPYYIRITECEQDGSHTARRAWGSETAADCSYCQQLFSLRYVVGTANFYRVILVKSQKNQLGQQWSVYCWKVCLEELYISINVCCLSALLFKIFLTFPGLCIMMNTKLLIATRCLEEKWRNQAIGHRWFFH